MPPRTILYTGKGGVGKTSVAAATARRCASQGQRTLVLSTDPAHSLSEALEAPLGSEPRPVTDRWGGETYRVLWQEAIAAAPDYVLITSWNEWHEGSEIEASVEYGSRILDDTAAFSREFLARPR